MILTKSVSRFARNTVDALITIRKLKEKNVAVLFEKEGVNTLDGTGEILLTILSSLAQEESRNMSEHLQEKGIRTTTGKEKWHATVVMKMLRNEKYMGDALLQKTYTVDFMTKKKVINNGIVPQYYVEDDHEAIIPKELFFRVQEEIMRRSSMCKSAVTRKKNQ